jgi:DNA-damage-inducible protein J
MMKTAVVNIRMNPETKAKAELLFDSFGITLSDAFNIFVNQSLYENAIPFRVQRNKPTPELASALCEVDMMIAGKTPKPATQSTSDFFAELRASGEI